MSDSESSMYVAGLRQLLTKSGRGTLSVFEADLPAKKILLKITATMSDRAETEITFNEMLEQLRADILLELMENWITVYRED